MSQSFRRQDILYNINKVIITCCDCGQSFILESVLFGEEDIIVMEQGMVDFCPYCGKDQRT